MAAVAGLAFASCKPTLIEGPDPYASVSASELEGAMSFIQYSDAAYTTQAADGNYITYNTNPSKVVQFYNYKSDGVTENLLATGATGSFVLKPKRGGSPSQTVYGRVVNADGSITEFSHTFNVFVPGDLDPELKLLLGESGKKSWTWNCEGVTCWGNAGNTGNGAAFTGTVVDGQWWGVETAEGLMDQLDHAGGSATGAEDSNAYMTFDEDGNITAYKSTGDVIYSSTFELKDYDASRASGWEIAKLVTKDPAVLFPFSINEGGKSVTEFDVMYLDKNYMTLVYTKGNAAGSWGEITYWRFLNKDDYEGALNGGSSRKWGWKYADAPVWGNAGNSGNGAGFTAGVVDGQWWGATPEELLGQNAHSGGVTTGDESYDAYMVFDTDGNVNCYNADGGKIRGGSYELDMYSDGRNAGWELGKLKTQNILFPFSINEGGVVAPEFDVMYMDGANMTLVYTKGNAAGSWGEITWWKFGPKE